MIEIIVQSVASTERDLKQGFKESICKHCVFRYEALTSKESCQEYLRAREHKRRFNGYSDEADQVFQYLLKCEKYKGE